MKNWTKILATTLAFSASAQAAILVTIDISDPSAVVISSVSNNSSQNVSGNSGFAVGLSFQDFFTSNVDITTAAPLTGDWTARGASAAYTELVTFDYGDPAVVAGDDLSIYTDPAAGSQDFITSAPAFTGSSTIDFSSFTAALPTIGATGTVNIGYEAPQGGSIGEWSVVPEPNMASALAGVIALGLVMMRRKI